MNTDENPNTSSAHGIMSIPTMMIFKNGELVDRLVGAMPKDAVMQKIEPKDVLCLTCKAYLL